MRKEFVGNAPVSFLTASLASGTTTTFAVDDATGYPTGATGPFVVTVSRSLGAEEKILCTSRSGNTFTISERGYDGTSAATHASGARVMHTLDSLTIDEANAYVNDDTGWLYIENLTMTNGWTVRYPGSGAWSAKYRRQNSIVRVEGLIAATGTYGDVAFILPVGFRIDSTQMFSSLNSNGSLSRLDVSSLGAFTFQASNAGAQPVGASDWLNLDVTYMVTN